MPSKVLMSFRISPLARAELRDLAKCYRTTMTDIMEVAVNRMWAEEFRGEGHDAEGEPPEEPETS